MTLGSLAPVLTNPLVQLFMGGMPFFSLAYSVDGDWLPPTGGVLG